MGWQKNSLFLGFPHVLEALFKPAYVRSKTWCLFSWWHVPVRALQVGDGIGDLAALLGTPWGAGHAACSCCSLGAKTCSKGSKMDVL